MLRTAGASGNAATRTAGGVRTRGWLERLILSEYLVFYLTTAYSGGLADRARDRDGELALQHAHRHAALLVVAIGQTFVLIVAGIDLSVTSIIAFASVVGASVMTVDGGYLGGLGARRAGRHPDLPAHRRADRLVQRLLLHPTRHAAHHRDTHRPDVPQRDGHLVHDRAQRDEQHRRPAQGLRPDRPGQRLWRAERAWVALAVGISAHLLLGHTVFGRWLYAIGINRAEISGVPVGTAIL
ncbi:MAG: hypothetical protein R3D28_25415 [Geminicoccaceae bacterium]